MSEWITDRLPVFDDADDNNDVLVPDASVRISGVSCRDFRSIGDGEPWHPKPRKYVPPKPKRREWWMISRSDEICTCDVYTVEQLRNGEPWPGQIHVREVLPTDPTPEAIEEVAAKFEAWSVGHPDDFVNAGRRLCGALAKKLRGES